MRIFKMKTLPAKVTVRLDRKNRQQLERLMQLKGWNEASFIVRRALARYLEEELRAFTPVMTEVPGERPLENKFAKTKSRKAVTS
jgi:hypothetical protein